MKPDEGIYINSLPPNRIDIEGRLNGRSPIRVIIQRGQDASFEVVGVTLLNFEDVQKLTVLLPRVIEVAQFAQNVMTETEKQDEERIISPES